MWLAVRAVATAIVGIGAAVILNKMAIPALAGQIDQFGSDISPMYKWVMSNHHWLPWIPLPALVLGLAAIMLRSLRNILAPLAAFVSLIAFIVIIGSLVVAMMPMYSMPKSFNLG